jgi:hypothetical protein
MPALPRLNMNEIPYISWKGQTLEQITSVYTKNTNTLNVNPANSIRQLMKPMPLKIYRREIASIQNQSCSRNSSTIAAFEQPGGSIVNSNIETNTGLVNILDVKPPSFQSATTITSEHPGKCAFPSDCFLSPDLNAKRRVRSAGMNQKKFKPDYNNDKAYFTSTTEYLVARNRTIQQNMYNYLRQGNSGVQPGTGNAKSNIYSPGGLSHCYQPLINSENNNNYFEYVWVDKVSYTVNIPDGNYDTESLNQLFKKVMTLNGHYFTNNTLGNKVFLLTIDYDNFNNVVILEANPATRYSPFPLSSYTPASFDWYTDLPVNPPNQEQYGYTSITISQNNNFGLVVGFIPGDYYNGGNRSFFHPTISPNYVPLYYKPSNVIFGTQGPVDSSTYIHRVKLNTVTKNGYLTKSAYGSATANAMAYGVSEQPYTIKDKIGFQLTSTPIIKPDGTICRDRKFIYRMK